MELEHNWNEVPGGGVGLISLSRKAGGHSRELSGKAWAIGGDEGQDRHRVDRVGRLG